jgi:hypothetical protein
LQVGVGFAERYSPFARVPEPCCADEDAGGDSLIERHQFDSGEYQFGGAGEHCLIEAKDFNAWKCSECVESVIESVEVVSYVSLISVQKCSRDCGVLFRYVAAGFGPREEASNCIRFVTGLTFRKDRFSRFAEADVRQVECEFATARAFQEVGGRWDVMMRWCGIAE